MVSSEVLVTSVMENWGKTSYFRQNKQRSEQTIVRDAVDAPLQFFQFLFSLFPTKRRHHIYAKICNNYLNSPTFQLQMLG